MPPLPQPRAGQSLLIKQRPVRFSNWPTRRGRVHHALQSLVFARDPWLMIARCIEQQCPTPRRPEALATLEQSKDFYSAAVSGIIIAARPLALYYSFMNLVKAYCLMRGSRTTFDQAQHGIAELRTPGAIGLAGAFLRAFQCIPTAPSNNFAEFKEVLTGVGLPATTDYQLPVLLPQVVPGHRVWAMESKKSERFISLHDLRFRQDRSSRTMWLDLYFVADDLSRLGITHQRLLAESGLSSNFREVDCTEQWNSRQLLRFEQVTALPYPDAHPADQIDSVIDVIRPSLWTTVATATPYRRYYVYLSPIAERPFVLPQLLSIYAIMYYLGSITRYRPHHYDNLTQGPYGAWIQEFVGGQPLQFLYLMASEFMRQDVTKPAIL